MSFTKQAVITHAPTAITDLVVVLRSPDPRSNEQPSASFEVGVLYNTGEIRMIKGDLVPHLIGQETNQLLSFMATLRARAATQLLP